MWKSGLPSIAPKTGLLLDENEKTEMNFAPACHRAVKEGRSVRMKITSSYFVLPMTCLVYIWATLIATGNRSQHGTDNVNANVTDFAIPPSRTVP